MKRVFLLLPILLASALAQSPPVFPRVGNFARPERLGLTLRGNASVPEHELREGIARQIAGIEEFGLDEATAYDAAFFVETFYRKRGFAKASVTPRITGVWRLELDIREGPRVLLGDVRLAGVKAFTDEEAHRFFLGPIRERFPRTPDAGLPFVESDLYAGADVLRRFYATNGYLDAEIDPPSIDVRGTVAAVTLVVHEGRQYTFGAIHFRGEPVFAEEELRGVVAQQTGNIYTPGRLAAAERALTDHFVKNGYFRARVTAVGAEAGSGGAAVPVEFLIDPGVVHAFDGSTIVGADRVRPSFVQNRLSHLHGKRYDPRELDATFRELIQTGLFRNLRITPAATAGNKVRLDVSFDEAKQKEFGFGLGYATFYGGVVSASYRDLNLLRTGRPLSINVEANQRGFTGEVLYRDPWLFETNNELRLRAYGQNVELKGYAKQEFGFNPSLNSRITRHWTLSTFLSARSVGLNSVKIEPETAVGPERYDVFAAGLSQTFDTRDNPSLPTRGFFVTTSVEAAGLSQVSYVRGLVRASYYTPVTKRTVFSLGARAGVVQSLNGDELPIDERFFNGGATTVRSFPEFGLGPRDRQGYPLGGETFTVFNAEYSFPVWGDLRAAVFADAGSVGSEPFDPGAIRTAIGAGLRYNLPVGAVRIDYGLNPAPAKGDPRGAFHFAIGVAF